MTGPPPATAAVRLAVRRVLPAGPLVAAVSGGADSLALAAAVAFERPGSGALVVDHGLQAGSAEVAARAAEQCRDLGLEARVLTASGAGDSVGGPEAAAREVRYALLEQHASEATVLLGHTLDDQAETVLLGLARGSGTRVLAGMPAARGRYLRPLLEVSRATTRQACVEAGLVPWEDPHNLDPAYARVRVRQALAVLDQALGPGLTTALARTAQLARQDADALDALACPTDDVGQLEQLPAALLTRSLKGWAEQQTGRAVTYAHVRALAALVTDWRGQGPVALPGGGAVRREGRRLAFDV